MKESGFALDDVVVNGFVNENGVTININSAKALNSVVGHEITHVLEGTDLYAPMAEIIIQHAKSKGEYDSRLEAITKLYEGRDANIEQELVADLVGDYLFSDPDFIRTLSTEHRNVFQKLYDEIKYLCKVATAGSKEARELEKVKKVFAELYREAETKNPTANGGVKYSLGVDMTEAQRYEELKNRTLQVVESTNETQYQEQLASIDALPPKAKSKVEKQIYDLAENLGILRKPMTTPEIQFEFQISKNNGLKKSLNNQLEYGGNYGDFARALVNLDQIIPNAVLIDAYTIDRYADTSRADKRFEGGYVLLGAFQDSENIVPVKLTIKKETGETGNLYVVVAMTKIKRTSVMGSEGTDLNGSEQPLPVTGSMYSLQDIISKINTKDADFLKYLPDGFLSESQKAAKQNAISKQKAKVDSYSLSPDIPLAPVREDIAQAKSEPSLLEQGLTAIANEVKKASTEQKQATLLEQALTAIAQQSEDSGIRDQLRSNQATLNALPSAADIHIPEDYAQMDITGKKNWVIKKLEQTGYKVTRKGFGIIDFAKKRLKSAFNYFEKGSVEEAAFEALPYVLENGIEISTHNQHKGRDYGTITIAAPITINGTRGNMAVVVKQTTGNYYKVHRILTPDGSVFVLPEIANEAESTPAGEVPETGSLATPKDSASVNSIPQSEPDVNQAVPSAESMIDRDDFVSRRASQLYEEIRDLKKGVRASQSLGYLLDHGYEWSSIKTALLNIRDNPNQVVNENSQAEATARELLGREYETTVSELNQPECRERIYPFRTECIYAFPTYSIGILLFPDNRKSPDISVGACVRVTYLSG